MNLYYGREGIRKEAFVFSQIKAFQSEKFQGEKNIVLVPEQFSLQGEKDAFEYLEVEGLIDVEILSFSRLATRIFAEVGGGRKSPLSRQGRNILLYKILKDQGHLLSVYKGMEEKQSFLEKTGNLIYEMKQYNTGPEDLKALLEKFQENSLLKDKLRDLEIIYSAYQEFTQNGNPDGEDVLTMVIDKIPESELIKNARFWIYGFDAFTPRNLELIGAILAKAIDVNVVISGDGSSSLFSLSQLTIAKFQALALEKGKEFRAVSLPQESFLRTTHSVAMEAIERQLYEIPPKPCADHSGITLVRAGNPYGEAESAAAYVLELIRDKGLRQGEIGLICNDMETRGPILRRVFQRYGIDIFLDEKRGIMHNPAIHFILSLVDIVENSYRTQDLFTFLKTGFSPLTVDQIEDLENYIIQYKIRGRQIKRPFNKGITVLGEDGLGELEGLRCILIEFLQGFEDAYKLAKTMEDKARVLYDFLVNKGELPVKLMAMMDKAQQEGDLEGSEEWSQVWSSIVKLLDQLVAILGKEETNGKVFGDLLRTGFQSVEMGLIPPTHDCLIVGTTQRTRLGKIKALLVVGANEGILPGGSVDEGLLSNNDKVNLQNHDLEVGRLREWAIMEEKLAIYRTFSRPSEFLWVSHSLSDTEGGKLNPSSIFTQLTNIFKTCPITDDLLSEKAQSELAQEIALVGTENSTLQHLASKLRKVGPKDALGPLWTAVLTWYGQADGPAGIGETNLQASTPEASKQLAYNPLDLLREALAYKNTGEKLSQEVARALYSRDTQGNSSVGQVAWDSQENLRISPSRLEAYGRCPFSFFISYGLKAEERRPFEISGIEMGDLYHLCLMNLSRDLSLPNVDITAPASPWMTVTKEQVSEKISHYLGNLSREYREGLLSLGREEEYRTERINKVCLEAAWMMVDHVRQGKIEKMYCEESFGLASGNKMAPIVVPVSQGRKVYIEGKIDRVDFLPGDKVKIIDYKSGRESLDLSEVRGGYALQLMLYLKAAQEEKREAAGILYFLIDQPSVEVSGDLESVVSGDLSPAVSENPVRQRLEKEIQKAFRLDGLLINQVDVIENIAGDFEDASSVVPLRKNKDGVISGTSPNKLLSKEDFMALEEDFSKVISQLSDNLASGYIDIAPKKTKKRNACEFCKYKGICRFDLSLKGCRYKVVSP